MTNNFNQNQTLNNILGVLNGILNSPCPYDPTDEELFENIGSALDLCDPDNPLVLEVEEMLIKVMNMVRP